MSMMKPSVEVHTHEHALIAEFWECLRLDPAPVKDLRNEYEAHVRAGGRPMLVVDMLGVGSALSTALSQFVTLLRVVRQYGGKIVFCNVDPMVTEVFRISKLAKLFLFAEDRAAALVVAADQNAAPELDPGPLKAPLGRNVPDARESRDPGGDGLLRRQRRRML